MSVDKVMSPELERLVADRSETMAVALDEALLNPGLPPWKRDLYLFLLNGRPHGLDLKRFEAVMGFCAEMCAQDPATWAAFLDTVKVRRGVRAVRTGPRI